MLRKAVFGPSTIDSYSLKIVANSGSTAVFDSVTLQLNQWRGIASAMEDVPLILVLSYLLRNNSKFLFSGPLL